MASRKSPKQDKRRKSKRKAERKARPTAENLLLEIGRLIQEASTDGLDNTVGMIVTARDELQQSSNVRSRKAIVAREVLEGAISRAYQTQYRLITLLVNFRWDKDKHKLEVLRIYKIRLKDIIRGPKALHREIVEFRRKLRKLR